MITRNYGPSSTLFRLGITATFLGGLAINFFTTKAVAVPSSKEVAKVVIEEVKFVEDKKSVLVPAKVEAKVQSTISADVEGHITKILKPLGSMVNAGETIMFIENKDPAFTYAKVPVRSPIAGVVSQLLAGQMSKVSRGDKLFTVVSPRLLKLSTEFSSSDMSYIRHGSKGTFRFAGGELKVRITGVSPMVDTRTGTAPGELEFEPGQKNLPVIGSIGQISFEVPQGKVMLLPENSLVYQEGKPLVRVVVAENKVEKKPVELGEQRENLYVIKSGLSSGEKVVVRSSRPVKEGEAIEIEKN